MSNERSNNKRALGTPVNKDIFDNFKEECKKIDIPMNVVLEIFMDEFSNGKVDIAFKRNSKGEFKGSLEYRL